jgi:hypothetical protein
MNRMFARFHRLSRLKKYQLFVELLHPTPQTRILNVGVIGRRVGLAEQFEEFYPHRHRVVGGSLCLADVVDYKQSYSEAAAVAFDGCALPFGDQSFDVVYSNATLEHLPSRAAQQRFAEEVVRVGRGWFVTTPNRWYPLEPHYHLPYIQLLPEAWQHRVARALGRVPYSPLLPLGKRDLRRLFPRGETIGCRVTFWPETLISYRLPS